MATYQYQKLTEPDAILPILLQPSANLDSPLHCTLLFNITDTLSQHRYRQVHSSVVCLG
jgi:hypothetical protein